MQSDEGVHTHAMNSVDQEPFDPSSQDITSEVVSLLMETGILIGTNFNSFLFKVIEKSNHKILKILIDHGIQYNQSMNFKTLLNSAIRRGNPLIIEVILPYYRFSQPSDQYIPRKFVIGTDPQYKDCVELLLKWNFIVDPNSRDDESFVYAAVKKGYTSIFVQLLEHGINVNMVNSKRGLNLLTIAYLYKHHKIVEILLEHNADVNVRIPFTNESLNRNSCFKRNIRAFEELFSMDRLRYFLTDVACLHIAVINFDPLMIEMFFKHGAKIEDYIEMFNLTSYAIRYNCEEIVRVFLDHGVKVTDKNLNGKSLLHFCVCWNDKKIDYGYNVAKLLLERGANIHLKTPKNKLVYNAINYGHRITARLFLNYNTDVQYIDLKENTLLHTAIQKEFDLEFIRILLKLNLPVNSKNSYSDTPLLVACKTKSKNQLEIITTLLDYDADICCTDYSLKTVLHVACDDLDLKLVTFFLERGINLNVTDGGGKTSLHYICKHNSDATASTIKLLLEYGADIEAVDNSGWTPLFVACEASNDAAVKCLLDNHANPHIMFDKGQTPLHITCYHDNDMTGRVIELLLGCGLNIEVADDRGWTPLFRACMIYGYNAVKCLLDNNANVNAVDHLGRTPFHYLCRFHKNTIWDIIQLLLKSGANINAVDKRGWTPLFIACVVGNDALVECLLANNANPHHVDSENTTLFHIAMEHHPDSGIVDMLLNHDVNVHCIDKRGKSVIHYIVEKNAGKHFDTFASMDINLNPVDIEGNTPLHIAVKKLSGSMTERLIKYGADINILNRNNKTPLEEVIEIVCPLDNSHDSLSLRKSKQQIIVMLKRQVVKLKVAGLKVHYHNLNIIYDTEDGNLIPKKDSGDINGMFDLQKLKVECEREIEMMKSYRTGIDRLTFDDLLTNHVHPPRLRSRIQTIQRKVDQEIFNNKFLLYIDIIRSRVREASIRCKRRKLMDSARNDFILKISRRLPDECIDMVLDYLNIEEVERFVETMKITQPQRKSTRKRKLTSLQNI